MNPWSKLLALPVREVWLLLGVSAVTLASELALRTLTPATLFRYLQRKTAKRTQGKRVTPDQLARFVEIADRYLPGHSSCLRRSVALSWVFRQYGLNGTLLVGVLRGGEGLRAHAWLQADGGASFWPSDDPFVPLTFASHLILSCAPTEHGERPEQ